MATRYFGDVTSNTTVKPQIQQAQAATSQQSQPQGKPAQNGETYPFPLMDRIVAGGVNVRYLELNGVKLKHQIITIRISEGGKRYAFETQAQVTNDRILGIMLTTTESERDDELKCINDSTIQLTIDNEEILPDGFDCSLISQKIGNAFYDNVYPINERADGSLIKGTITSSSSYFKEPFDVKLYLWSVTKPRK
ncbi:MAG: hypothetical protein IJ150_01335 [Bacteroidales bacterium]|nr:hypothetical protein [Bacteroidales bacterium]